MRERIVKLSNETPKPIGNVGFRKRRLKLCAGELEELDAIAQVLVEPMLLPEQLFEMREGWVTCDVALREPTKF